jgi:hypothetical protein
MTKNSLLSPVGPWPFLWIEKNKLHEKTCMKTSKNLRLTALEFQNDERMIDTLSAFVSMKPHKEVLEASAPPTDWLQECAPTCTTLIDPPKELTPLEKPLLLVTALQLKQGASLMTTLKPLLIDVPHLLLLMPEPLQLQEYAPTYKTLIDPPIELEPKNHMLLVFAMQLMHDELLTLILKLLALDNPHVLLLLLADLLKLQAYAPTYTKLIDPP